MYIQLSFFQYQISRFNSRPIICFEYLYNLFSKELNVACQMFHIDETQQLAMLPLKFANES